MDYLESTAWENTLDFTDYNVEIKQIMPIIYEDDNSTSSIMIVFEILNGPKKGQFVDAESCIIDRKRDLHLYVSEEVFWKECRSYRHMEGSLLQRLLYLFDIEDNNLKHLIGKKLSIEPSRELNISTL